MVTEQELGEMVLEVLGEKTKNDYINEVNRLLGTAYTVDDVEWDEVSELYVCRCPESDTTLASTMQRD